MQDMPLFHAVAAFAQATAAIPDADLERDYAWRYHDEEGVRFAFLGTYHELRDLAATLADERAASGSPITAAQRVLAQYHAAYRDLQAALIGVSHDEAQRAPAEGEWPLWRAVVHISMAEQNFFPRVVHGVERRRAGLLLERMSEEERQAFLAREPASDSRRLLGLIFGPSVTTWAEAEEAPDPTALHGQYAELLAFYDALHTRILRELAGLSDADLRAPSLWWEEAEVPARYRLHRLDAHLRQHTIQVDKTLAMLGRGPSEALRLLRLIYAALAEAEGAIIGAPEVGVEQQRAAAEAITARAGEVGRLLA